MADDHHLHLGEAAAMREYWSLTRDPVFRGRDVPQGDGSQVLVLPGLFGNDLYLTTLRHWLKRIGYEPLGSHLTINAGCPNRLMERVEQSIGRTDGPLAIVAHSRGGMLGKSLAHRLGGRCTCLIALGSPVGAVMRAGREGLEAMARSRNAGNSHDEAVASERVVDAGRRALKFFDPDCETPFLRLRPIWTGCSHRFIPRRGPLPSTATDGHHCHASGLSDRWRHKHCRSRHSFGPCLE